MIATRTITEESGIHYSINEKIHENEAAGGGGKERDSQRKRV